MNSPLLLLPLDDRPVNADYPVQLAAIAGEVVLTPPGELLGHFSHPGDQRRLQQWLWQQVGQTRALVLSLDMLVYGGLVASRTPVVTVEEALHWLQVLRELKAQYPHLRIYAFNVIMRLTITSTDVTTRAAGRDIFRYSVLRDQVERLGDISVLAELDEVTARIPEQLLAAYLTARVRNHAINSAALALLADGVLDYLALVQEDTAPVGLHIREQQTLQCQAEATVAPDDWALYPGTDEAAMTLLARFLLRETGLNWPVALCCRDEQAALQPALFEDRALRESARCHIAAVGASIQADGAALAVHTFTPPQQDLFEMEALPFPTWEKALAIFPRQPVRTWLAALATPLAIADVAYCNGGDPRLLDVLLRDGSYWQLTGYAGWNTAGNTLGTTLAHAAMCAIARARDIVETTHAAHERALLIRLLDDGVYQPIVRAWAMQQTVEHGYAPLNLRESATEVSDWVDSAMQHIWQEWAQRYTIVPAYTFQARLPWGRLFEVKIDLGVRS